MVCFSLFCVVLIGCIKLWNLKLKEMILKMGSLGLDIVINDVFWFYYFVLEVKK